MIRARSGPSGPGLAVQFPAQGKGGAEEHPLRGGLLQRLLLQHGVQKASPLLVQGGPQGVLPGPGGLSALLVFPVPLQGEPEAFFLEELIQTV